MNRTVRQELLQLCYRYVQDRMDAASNAIRTAQQSANEDTKSSMGDKYETGRAMAQLEIEKSTVQLAEASKLKQVLDRILLEVEGGSVKLGSVVITSSANYFVSVGAGALYVEGICYYAVSGSSPVGLRLLSAQAGDILEWAGKRSRIEKVI